MKKALAALGALLLVLGFFHCHRKADAPPAPPSAGPTPTTLVPTQSLRLPPAAVAGDPGRTAFSAPRAEDLASFPSHPDAISFGDGSRPPESEPAQVLALFQSYRERFGTFPTGEENRHFMNALRGANPRRLAIFPLVHPRLNADGELLDAWGQPFILHKLSRHHLEIRSAGPDRRPYSADDLVSGSLPGAPSE